LERPQHLAAINTVHEYGPDHPPASSGIALSVITRGSISPGSEAAKTLPHGETDPEVATNAEDELHLFLVILANLLKR